MKAPSGGAGSLFGFPLNHHRPALSRSSINVFEIDALLFFQINYKIIS